MNAPWMSAIGTKRTSRVAPHMSAIGGKADIEILEYCKADMKIGPDSLPT